MKNKNPLVSVIMNCYNGEKFLNESIKSVKNQIYENWELIFWDNCSTDESRNIVQSYKDKRIKYFLAEKFTNLHQARNLALKKAKGDYISFLDCDDILLKDKLSLQVNKIYNENYSVIYSNCYVQNENTFLKKKKIFKVALPEGLIPNELLFNYVICLPTVLIKKQIIDKFFFNENYEIISDRDLIMKISLEEKFGCVQSPLAICRIHDNNFSSKNKLLEFKELEHWIFNFDTKYTSKFHLNKIAIIDFKKKIEILKNIYSSEGINQKILTIKLLIKNINMFNFVNFLRVLLPRYIRKKIFFFHR